MRLGIFGGSFDPIHNGHLIVAQLVREKLGLDEVIFMVSGQQPLKSAHGTAASHRLRMVELALEGVPGFSVDAREVAREGPSYTIDTLSELHVDRPHAEFFLLIGADAAREFPRWKKSDEVSRLARLTVFSRGELRPDSRRIDVEVPHLDISSTTIRARAESGLSVVGWVPSRVADYISGLDLYQTQGGVG